MCGVNICYPTRWIFDKIWYHNQIINPNLRSCQKWKYVDKDVAFLQQIAAALAHNSLCPASSVPFQNIREVKKKWCAHQQTTTRRGDPCL